MQESCNLAENKGNQRKVFPIFHNMHKILKYWAYLDNMHKLILHQKKFWIIARPSFAYTTSELWRNQWLSDKSWKIHKHAWRRRYRSYLKNGSNSFIETMNNASAIIKERCPKIYSQELVEHLFSDFYTKMNTFVKSFQFREIHPVNICMNLRKLEFW